LPKLLSTCTRYNFAGGALQVPCTRTEENEDGDDGNDGDEWLIEDGGMFEIN